MPPDPSLAGPRQRAASPDRVAQDRAPRGSPVARRVGFVAMTILCLLVAAYAVGMYGFGQPGERLHPEMRAVFQSHPIGIKSHIFASALALLLGPFQFSTRLRNRVPTLHRWMGRLYLGIAVLVGGTAGLYMAQFAFGGLPARLGFACLAVAWLYTGARAYAAILAGDVATHRRWMMRNFALAFAAVTLRLYLPSAIAMRVPPELAYPVIAWACWVPNLLAAEWLARARHGVGVPRNAFESG